jgi:hypothetical protein
MLQSLLVEPDLSGLFQENAGWHWASFETSKRHKLFPNQLAYWKSQATFGLIVQRSTTGTDFAMSAAGLNHLLAALERER